MRLTTLEREVLTDSLLKIESIEASLAQIDGNKLPGLDEIHTCLASANRCFTAALRASPAQKKR